jgi:hypothetical protein
MSASTDSTLVFDPLLDAHREPARDRDAVSPAHGPDRRPRAEAAPDRESLPGDSAYVADWVI